MTSAKSEVVAKSTFAQRFEFARDRQRGLGTWQEDAMLAAHLGVAASQITEYKARGDAPPARRTLAIAQWCAVDPGWLSFGEDSAAPAPEGFDLWLRNKKTTPTPEVRQGRGTPIRAAPAEDAKPVRRRRAGGR